MSSTRFKSFVAARAFVHTLGLRTTAQWRDYCRSGDLPPDIPRDPPSVYGDKFRGWGNWLGTGRVANQERKFRSYEDARSFVRALALSSREDWKKYVRTKGIPADIPRDPPSSYGDEFRGWGDWLGTGRVRNQDRPFRPFDEARAFSRALGLPSVVAWREYCAGGQKPNDIPALPERTYADTFVSYDDWLAIDRSKPRQRRAYRPFAEAREYVRDLGLKNYRDWRAFAKSGKLPQDIPANPRLVYSDEYEGDGDWIGTGRLSNRARSFLPYEAARAYVRSLGLKNGDEWTEFCRSGKLPANIPKAPASTYEGEFGGMGDWLGTGAVAARERKYRPFEDARTLARSLNLKSQIEWATYARSGRKPDDVPANVAHVYRESWKSWGDWLGTGFVAPTNRTFRPFDEARAFARGLGLRSREEWKVFYRSDARPNDIPSDPLRVYGSEWRGWGDWLGTGNARGREYRSFEEARAFARALGMKTGAEWRDTWRSGKLPADLPADPSGVYSKQWKGWGDWLGTGKLASHLRTFRPFEEARAFARSLGIRTQHEWRDFARSDQRPVDIPNNPDAVYRDEFRGYGDWLGVMNKWTQRAIAAFVRDLRPHMKTFDPAELYLILRQNGMIEGAAATRALAQGIFGGRLPADVESGAQADASDGGDGGLPPIAPTTTAGESDEVSSLTPPTSEAEPILPNVSAADVLAAAACGFFADADEEAVEFLVASGVAKCWHAAYRDPVAAERDTLNPRDDEYAERIRARFRAQYDAAVSLPIPPGYAFRPRGPGSPISFPNLMQKHVAADVRDRRRVGNWSGTGAGKTLSAVLASRVINARLTVICCPNAVVGEIPTLDDAGSGWCRVIAEAFPGVEVQAKTLTPTWKTQSDPRYLVLNYETFQQEWSEARLKAFVERELVDLIVIDEIHYAKQRNENMSQRKRLVQALVAESGKTNEVLAVLGMSATPVINNLAEGRSMVELITGIAHDELETRASVSNAMALHQRLVTLGIRWRPTLSMACNEAIVDVDCSDLLDDVRALGKTPHPQAVEAVLTQARIPTILEHIRAKTLVYTHYVDGIVEPLREAISKAGWRVAVYSGDDKTGLSAFLSGDADVLIGTSTVGTGVDGLQFVSSRMIINALPWTAAEYDQLKGRLYRQGQIARAVKVVIPRTFADVGGERWSWCQGRLDRIRWKRSLADAAVDGVVPEGQLVSPEAATKALIGWLSRIESGKTKTVERRVISIPLAEDSSDSNRRRARYGDFSAMNASWNRARSDTTHERLRTDPAEWEQYHSLYRQARASWPFVPFEVIAESLGKMRAGKVVGDFGCGEAELAKRLVGKHVVHSFDHVAVDESVVSCDLADLPLPDSALDVAVFCLSLMGANAIDYLREAYRCLDVGGTLIIVEAASRISDVKAFEAGLRALGFDIANMEPRDRFLFITGVRADRDPRADVELGF